MALIITYDVLRKAGFDEIEPHRFIGEASGLRMPVVGWPEQIETTIGNGRPLLLTNPEMRDGDLLAATYRQANGCISIRIFND